MKTLVVLTALAAVAIAGPTYRAGDTDLGATKIGKRSPTLHHQQHHIPQPLHLAPVHHTYVQPIIPHHLGLKKPLLVKKPYGHHIFRSEEEKLETHSAESKESKNKCMKEMEAKCDDDVFAKSSELEDSIKIQDIDSNVSDREVAQSLQMAKEAVDTLQKKLELAEKNSKMTQWKHGMSESDGRMHENVETAKLALEHMQRNFGNLESMNVHAREFKNAKVHDVNLELKSDMERLSQWKDAIENLQKNVELVRNIEDSFQDKENSPKSAALEKSSDLKHEMTDDHKGSDVHHAQSEKSATLEEQTSVKHDLNNDNHATKEEKTSEKMIARDMETKSTDGKTSWQAREHEKSSKTEMETSASTLSESKTIHHTANEHQAFRSETHSEKVSDLATAPNAELIADHQNMKGFKEDQRSVKITENKETTKPTESISHPTMKSSDNLDMQQTHLEHEKMAPIVDTTTLMKSAEHSKFEKHGKMEEHSPIGHPSHMTSHSGHLSQMGSHSGLSSQMGSHNGLSSQVGSHSGLQSQIGSHSGMSSQMGSHSGLSSQMGSHSGLQSQIGSQSGLQSQMGSHSGLQSQIGSHVGLSSQIGSHSGHSSDMEHNMGSHLNHHKSSSSGVHGKDAHEISVQVEQGKQIESLNRPESSSSVMISKDAHTMMKSSDQMAGQSQQMEVAFKPTQALQHQQFEKLHHTAQHAHGKSAEDGGLFAPIEMNSAFKNALVPSKSWKEAISSSRGAYGSGLALGGGYGSGSGAVGVFPNAHVGGCAIPLLLSCSPSVVAGSLAKSHGYAAPSYAASGYRASESSHTKRDITKISSPYKVKRTPSKDLKQKTVLITDKL